MQIRQLCPHFGQLCFAWSYLVTGDAAELLEALSPLTLRGRAAIFRHFRDDGHRLQCRNASFESLRPLLTLFREAELAVFSYGVAPVATASIEYILGDLPLTLASGDHSVQRSV